MFIPSFLSLISASLAATCLRPFLPDGSKLTIDDIARDQELFLPGDAVKYICELYSLNTRLHEETTKCQENGTWTGGSQPICGRDVYRGLPVTTSSGQCKTDCNSYHCFDRCFSESTEWTLDLLGSPDVLGVRFYTSNYDQVDSVSLEISSSSSESVHCDAPVPNEHDSYSYISCPLRSADRLSLRFSKPVKMYHLLIIAKTKGNSLPYRNLPGYVMGDKYLFVEKKLNYTEAERTCEENGAELLGETTEFEDRLLKMRLESWAKQKADQQYVSTKVMRTARWIGSSTSGENAVSGINWTKTYVNPEEEHYSICQFSKFDCTDFPGIPLAGRIIEHEKGSKVTYECFDSYSMVGPNTRTCNKTTGEYEPEMPTCVKRFR